MKSFLPPLAALFALGLCANIILDPKEPIYIGDAFYPPTMNFIAWLPGVAANFNTEWCSAAQDASDHKPFSLGGVTALQLHDYFSQTNAYITREGHRFADCVVTPASGRMGSCLTAGGSDRKGGRPRFAGVGFRGYSCWVIDGEWEKFLDETAFREGQWQSIGEREMAKVTGEMQSPIATSLMAPMGGEGIKAAFTPGATGGY